MKTISPPRRPFLSIATFANELDLNPETVRRAVHRGEIPVVKLGCVYRIPREILDEWRKTE